MNRRLHPIHFSKNTSETLAPLFSFQHLPPEQIPEECEFCNIKSALIALCYPPIDSAGA